MPTLSEYLEKRTKAANTKTLAGLLEERSNRRATSARGTNPFRSSISSDEINTVEGLVKLAEQKGFLEEIEKITQKPKLSILQRLSVGLSALNPANAIYDQLTGTRNFLAAYPTDVAAGIAAAVTGDDIGEMTQRKYFGDIAEYLGVENKIARFGIGLVGDILLDPSTYFGGTIVRLGAQGIGKGTSIVGKGFAKVAPEAAEKLGQSAALAKDAFGDLFVHGYGTTKGLTDKYATFRRNKTNVLKGLAISNAKRYGADTMSDTQWEEFLDKLFAGKKAEFDLFDNVADEQIDLINKRFPDLKLTDRKGWAEKVQKGDPESWAKATDAERDLMVRSAVRANADSRLRSVGERIPVKIERLTKLRQALAQPLIQGNLVALKNTVAELRKELDELVPTSVKEVEKKPFYATREQIDGTIMNALSFEKDKYKNTILGLQARINAIESGILEPAEKEIVKRVGNKRQGIEDILQSVLRNMDPKLALGDRLVEIDQEILRLTNEMMEKQFVLENLLSSKTIAKERIAKAFASGDFSNLPDEIAVALQRGAGIVSASERLARKRQGLPEFTAVEEKLRERLKLNAQNARKAGIDNPFTIYAPSIRDDITEKSRVLAFLQGTSRLGLGSQAFKKEFKNLLQEDELLRDRTLFMRVEDQIATDSITQAFFKDILEDVGKPVTAFRDEKAARAAGYALLREKGAYGKELGYLPLQDHKFLMGQIGGSYAAIDAIAKASGFDVLNSLFKRWVTGPFAPFYVRNFASGKMQNFEEIGITALHPRVLSLGARLTNKISKGSFTPITAVTVDGRKVVPFREVKRFKKFGDKETVDLGGKTWLLNDIADAFEKRFGGSTFYNNEYNSLTRDAQILEDSAAWSKEALAMWGKKATSVKGKGAGQVEAIFGEINPVFRTGRVIGNYIELNQKADATFAALMKGHTLDEALNIAEKAGFDYSKLSTFESHVLRRLIPFYTFNRKNLELQLRTLKNNPQRINQIIRAIDNVQVFFPSQNLSEEEKKGLPTYLNEYLSAPAGRSEDGLPQFVRNFGTPIEAFTNLVKTSADGKSSWERTFLATLSQVTPYIKAPVEYAIGKDSFRQRDIKDVYSAPEYEKAPEFIKDWLKLKPVQRQNADGLYYTTYVADPERLFVLRSLFTSRGVTYLNNVFNGDVEGFMRIMNAVSGVQTTEINTDFYASLTERQQKEELGDLLRRYGIVGEFSRLFIPKE